MLLPNTNIYPNVTLVPQDEGSAIIAVRERPPLWLMALIKTPRGRYYRFAEDEPHTRDVMMNESHSATIPGGFERCDLALPRDMQYHYDDLTEFSDISILGFGDLVAWDGRIESSPRTFSSSETKISPNMVGYQAHLDDVSNCREIIQDMDLSHWGPEGATQKITDALTWQVLDPEQIRDLGVPALRQLLTGAWTKLTSNKALYDAHGIPLAGVFGGWKLGANLGYADPNWTWFLTLLEDDVQTGWQASPSLRTGPGPSYYWHAANNASKTFALAELHYALSSAGVADTQYDIFWTCLAAVGRHGLPLQGATDYKSHGGFLASDIVNYIVTKWCPKLSVIDASGASTITPTSFVINHMLDWDGVAPSEFIKRAARFDLPDWAVWENKRFWMYPPGTRGKRWRATVGASELSDAGPQVDRIFNNAIVQYEDVGSGVSTTIGPPGSGCMLTDPSLTDSDPLNPATLAGLTRYPPSPLAIGKATKSQAVQIGAVFLQEQKILYTAGNATLVAYVQDDRSIWWPAWRVRPGDYISFTDAYDTSYRKIVSTQWSNSDKTQQITLDSPPDGLAAVLERLGAQVVNQ